jgi:hypothetical protein
VAESKGCRQDILVVVPMMASPGQERRVHSCQFLFVRLWTCYILTLRRVRDDMVRNWRKLVFADVGFNDLSMCCMAQSRESKYAF